MMCIQRRREKEAGGQPDRDVVCQEQPEETCLKLYAVTDERFWSSTSATSAGIFFARGGCYCFSI